MGSHLARGAVAGAAAAAVWAAQQPLDKRVFGVEYDDCELLGRTLTRGRGAYPAGVAWHLVNGAVFGAAYARLAPALPGPGPVRGAAAGLAEHLATWPPFVTLHPVGRPLRRSGRAFAQATWRHVLFGVTLGALERRLNPPPSEPERPAAGAHAAAPSPNGHGDARAIAHAEPV